MRGWLRGEREREREKCRECFRAGLGWLLVANAKRLLRCRCFSGRWPSLAALSRLPPLAYRRAQFCVPRYSYLSNYPLLCSLHDHRSILYPLLYPRVLYPHRSISLSTL